MTLEELAEHVGFLYGKLRTDTDKLSKELSQLRTEFVTHRELTHKAVSPNGRASGFGPDYDGSTPSTASNKGEDEPFVALNEKGEAILHRPKQQEHTCGECGGFVSRHVRCRGKLFVTEETVAKYCFTPKKPFPANEEHRKRVEEWNKEQSVSNRRTSDSTLDEPEYCCSFSRTAMPTGKMYESKAGYWYLKDGKDGMWAICHCPGCGKELK